MFRRFAAPFVLSLTSSIVSGCAAEAVPSMIEVADVQPREVEVGDRIEIVGAGFPLHRTAHVLLRGMLHRPGLAAEPIAISVDAEARSEGKLELQLDREVAERIVGSGEAALHATFRGDVVVSFAPAEAGTAPLAGKASQVVLDVRPDRVRTVASARREESARKLLDFLGITLSAAAPASGGLLVASVRADSPAARAGVEPRQTIVDFDGVRVSNLADLAPSSDAATLGLRREGETEVRTAFVPLAGFSQRVPRSLAFAALLAGIASTLVLLSSTKPSAKRAFVERAVAERVRLGAKSIVSRALPSVGLVAATAPLLPIAQSVLGIDLDAAALIFVTAGALFALSLSTGRARESLGIARDLLPAVIASAAVVVATGSPRIDDVLRAQGALPWEWFAFRTPAMTALVSAWIASAAGPRVRRDDAGLVATSVLIATLFLGGWRLPGVALERDAWSSWHLLAALAFAVKAALVAGVVRGLSVVLPTPAAERAHPTWRVHAPLAALGLAVTFALASLPAAATRLLGLATFVGCCALGLFALLRVASSVRKIAVRHVDPAI